MKPSNTHPWKIGKSNLFKLKAARKIRKKIYERTSEVRNDDFYAVKVRENSRNRYRKKVGIPLDAPLIKSGKPFTRAIDIS